MFKCTLITDEGEERVQYVENEHHMEAFKKCGYDVEEIDATEVPKVNKGGRPKKEEE